MNLTLPYCRSSPLRQLPDCLQMPLYVTIMFDLSFHHLGGDWIGHFHDILQPSDTPGNANTQHLLIKSLPKDFEGQTRRHESVLLSLNLPAGPPPLAPVAAVISPNLSSPAGYHYQLIHAVGVVSNIVRRLLGCGTPPRHHARCGASTQATTWYCHKCNNGPYNIAAQSGCTNVINGRQCDHTRCEYCRKE